MCKYWKDWTIFFGLTLKNPEYPRNGENVFLFNLCSNLCSGMWIWTTGTEIGSKTSYWKLGKLEKTRRNSAEISKNLVSKQWVSNPILENG